ncbi:MAG: hypothetical protein HXX17_07030 [Geobacteraceae bacterium]|nr:hypothetical protein [Geobacteraceae bacterium]
MKRFLLGGVFAIFYSSIAYAGPVSDVWNEYLNKNDNRTVLVFFHTEGNVDAASTKIINLMKTKDPGGYMNPYWIVNIAKKGINKKTKCGIIAGTWYRAGFPSRAQWFSIMEDSQKFTDLHALVYSTDDGLKPISEHQLNAKTLMEMCND